MEEEAINKYIDDRIRLRLKLSIFALEHGQYDRGMISEEQKEELLQEAKKLLQELERERTV